MTVNYAHPNARAWLKAHPEVRPARVVGTVYFQGCDFAYGSGLTTAQLTAAGKKFVCRYLSGTPGAGKDIGTTELANYKAANIAVVLNWETSGQMNSEAQGVSDAKAANAEAATLGEANAPIIFSADFDPTGNTAGIVAYMTGVVSVIGKARAGIYGGIAAIEACASICTYFWQTYAWSNGALAPNATLYQYDNGVSLGPTQVDLDEALAANFGQINATPPPPPLPAFPTPAGLTATATATGVTLSWNAVPGADAGYFYEVVDSAGAAAEADSSSTSASVTLAPGTYQARVSTHPDATHTWSAWTDWVSFTVTLTPYPTPIGLASAQMGQARLSWEPVTGATYQYEVETAAGVVVIGATDVTSSDAIVTLPFGSYNFRVIAHVSPTHNWSPWSAWVPFSV